MTPSRRKRHRWPAATAVALSILSWSPATRAGDAPAEGHALAGDAAAKPEATPWAVRASMAAYLFPDGTGFLLPIVAADHGWLHLEGRFNYEARNAGSVWIGWNFEWGEKLTFALTPMLGGVFGDLNGVAPGAEWTLAWGPLELYTEFEFVIDCGDVARSSIYGWTEVSARPWEWVRGGIALQRTRSTGSPRGVQWGPLVGFDHGRLSLSAYWFNPGQSDAQYWVVSLGVSL